MGSNQEIYDRVFGQVTELMAQGDLKWMRAWRDHDGIPRNAVTGRHYNGGNILALLCQGFVRGYSSAGWMTKRQAHLAGCWIRAEEFRQSTTVYFIKRHVRRARQGEMANADGNIVIPLAREFWVYNVDQMEDSPRKPGAVDGLRAKLQEQYEQGFADVTLCEEAVAATGAVIRHGKRLAPSYQPSADVILMPTKAQWDTAEGYYGVLWHELTHWTGHASRLDRLPKAARFGAPEYAFEELVAELGSLFLSMRSGVPSIDKSAAYLQHWQRMAIHEPEGLQKAAVMAKAAADYLWPEAEYEAETVQEAA